MINCRVIFKIKFLIIFVFIFLASISTAYSAENFFVTQSGAGSHNGSSVGNAWSAAEFNTSGNWGAGAGKISGADTVYLSGSITTGLTMQGSGTSGNVITIDGANATLSGVFTATSKSWFKLQNATWSSGLTTPRIISMDLSSNAELNDITVPNYSVNEMIRMWGASYITIDGLTANNLQYGMIDFRYSGATQSHHITLRNLNIITTDDYMATTQRDLIRGCAYDITIEKSYIYQRWTSDYPSSAHNDILQFWGDEDNPSCTDSYNLVIRHNKIIHDTGTGVDGNFQDIIIGWSPGGNKIYGNLFVKRGGNNNGTTFMFGAFQGGTNDIYNNTFVVQSGSPAYYLWLLRNDNSGTTFNFKNNIVYNNTSSPGRIAQDSGTVTFNHTHNTYYGGSSTSYLGTSCSSYASTGELCSSDPLFTDYANDDFRIGTNSPAYNTGTDLGSAYNVGLSTSSSSFSNPTLIGRPQATLWDKGAYEYAGSEIDVNPPSDSKVPMAPSVIRID